MSDYLAMLLLNIAYLWEQELDLDQSRARDGPSPIGLMNSPCSQV